MQRNTKIKVSPISWNLIAVSAIWATLYQSICMISMSPNSANRVGFALSGLIAVAASRRAMRTHASHWRIAGNCFVGAFCVALIAAILLPLFARCTSRSKPPSPRGNLRQLALGLSQYAQDYDGRLPPPNQQSEMHAALAPYLKSEASWKYTNRGFFTINPATLGHTLSEFESAPDGTSTMVLAFAPHQETLADGVEYRLVAFTDANVRHISERRFQALLRGDEMRATLSNLPQ